MDKDIISYCVIGHSACITNFVFEEILGKKQIKLYQGSIEEYSNKF